MFKVPSVRNGLGFLTTPPVQTQSTKHPPSLSPTTSPSHSDDQQLDMSLSDTVHAVLSTSPSPESHGTGDSISDTRLEHQHQEELNDSLRRLERQRHIEHLVSSEEKYCIALQRLLTLYHRPLSQTLSADHTYSLFGDIESIYEQQFRFWQRLQSTLKSFDGTETVLGDAISNWFHPPLRVLYQNYANRHEQAMLLLDSLQNDNKVESPWSLSISTVSALTPFLIALHICSGSVLVTSQSRTTFSCAISLSLSLSLCVLSAVFPSVSESDWHRIYDVFCTVPVYKDTVRCTEQQCACPPQRHRLL